MVVFKERIFNLSYKTRGERHVLVSKHFIVPSMELG